MMPAWLFAVVAVLTLATTRAYLILVPDTAPPGHVVIDAAVYKLGSERNYNIDVHRTANFVHHILRVNRTSGLVTLRKRLRCDGVLYPNLFTFYVDSTSERIRDIDYYSLPIRILVTGEDCSRRHADLYDIDFDRVYDQNDAALQYEEQPIRDKREAVYQESIDWRLLEGDELVPSQYNVLSTAYPWSNVMFEDFVARNKSRMKRSQNVIPFDMAIDVKIAEAKQWISETYASFAIPTTDRWQGICLKQSQFVNSLTAFLPRTVQKMCKVQFLDVSDPRFMIEVSQGDLVASGDICIQEPMWKVSILFTFNCEKINIVDSDHRLKIVYHHQELNDTDIARRVKRELRNQSPYFEQALDPENSPVTYSMSSLLDSRSAGMFAVDSRTGVVTTQARLDRERLDVHYFRVVAQDDTFPPRSGTTTLQINVLDCNDHSPVFEMQQYESSVREGASPGTTVLTLKATDQDIGKNAEVEYSIESVTAETLSTEDTNESIDNSEQIEAQDVFRIDGRSGALLTRSPLDREKVARYTVIVKATDQASPVSDRLSSTATVHVNILDDNDNYPQFSEKTYTVTVDEDISANDNPVIARIKATDADVGANAAIRYAIIGGNTQMQFSIDSLSGDVSLVKPLDYEQVRSYRLVIRAQAVVRVVKSSTAQLKRLTFHPSRSNTTQLLVNVKDVNDNAPRFYTSLFQESVSENVPVGYSIVRVQAYDADEGMNAEITYTLMDKEYNNNNDLPISIDPRSGWVYTSSQLDREVQAKYQLMVTATDGGTPPRSATASVVVVVQDVNDNDPVFSPPQYEVELAEDEPPGTPVVTLTATDADEDNRLHYEITGGNTRGRFSITSQNGRGLITVAQPLDFKQERRYVLTVTATDSGGRSDTAMVHINITDANNYAPVFENAPYTASVFEDAPVGTTVLVVSATDSDVGVNAQITYSLSSEISNEAVTHHDQEFIINPQTGAITTNKLLDRESMSGYLLTVTARDGGVPSLSDTTDVEISVVDVNDNAPVFKQQLYTATIMEDALVGTSVTQVSATDADVGLNGRVHYELEPKDREEGSFVVDPASGVIRTNKALDRESVIVHIKVEDINDSPPVFESDCLTFYIPENSPIGTTVGEIYAHDPDEGPNAVVHYSIKGGDDSNSFSLETRQGSDKAELVTMVDLDYESPRKKYELIIRAASPPLWNDVRVEILVTDVNDNAPMMKDFQIIFNNYKDCFPVGPFGRVPAYDADVTDKLQYRILSGNNANLVLLNETSGEMTLSPQLNTNVPKLATMEISVTDGVNEVKAMMQLQVRLITEQMLFNSITDDTDVTGNILNVSFSARRPEAELGVAGDTSPYYSPTHLRERVYLHRATLARLATVQVLPFDDNICVHEPCLNYEECLTVLKFGNATDFINSVNCETVLTSATCSSQSAVCRSGSQCVAVREGGILCQGCAIDADHTTPLCELKARSFPASSFLTFPGLKRRNRLHLKLKFLDLTGPLQIGGLPNIPSSFQVKNKDFQGCISDLYIDHKFIDLNSFVADNGTLAGCPEKRSQCSSAPCYNGAECKDLWDTYLCECTEGYTGKDCADSTLPPWRFSGDGMLSFNPLLRPIQLPWLNALSLRTRQQDAFLMSIQVGQNSTILITLKSGQLHYSYNGESMYLPTTTLSDGSWHRIDIKWLGTDISVTVDYGLRTVLLPMLANKIQGQYIGKILIGGPDSTAGLLASEDVRVGTAQSLLNRPTVRENVRDGCQSRADCMLSICPPYENHYKPEGSEDCLPCQCYAAGSVNSSCEVLSGQCYCHAGVIGRACDSCANLYAEVAPNTGCEVVYDGCPRSFSHGVWWPRTKFGVEAITDCPTGTSGKATRMCDETQVVPWQEPDMFNCTTSTFYQLRKQLSKIESGELSMNTFVGVRLAADLSSACEQTPHLYGADVLVAEGILLELLQYEMKQAGLNLTHSQDKDYVRVMIGVDIVTAESIYGFEPTQLNRYNIDSYTTERVVLPDTSSFIHSPIQTPIYHANGKIHKHRKPSSPTVSFPKYNNYVKSIVYANKGTHHQMSNHVNQNSHSKNTWPVDDPQIQDNHGPVVIQPTFKKQEKSYASEDLQENESSYVADKIETNEGPKVMALVSEMGNSTKDGSKKKLVYKSLSGIRLKRPIRLQMWLDIDRETFGSRTNPQCVHWSTLRGCFIPEPSLLESVTSYTAFSISLPLLLITWLALCLMRGGAATVSNSIHKHLIFCVFMAELLYLIALKARSTLVQNEVSENGI
ncbi:hypothetical protein HF086_014409 [Spodoptera exigua]|uniref:Protocadherin-like wing polarity protein stan n=1 Tax=Spodoptera exigua TaxID=7107 RepID=A0A922MY83_SPOEX|nr:hypothetical protein HF086_014409 [Spodoptera exigua]